MEISPIAGIRVMAVTKARPVDPELTAAFKIESLTRPEDDTSSPHNRKAADAEDVEEDPEELEDLSVDEADREPVAVHHDSQISIFA